MQRQRVTIRGASAFEQLRSMVVEFGLMGALFMLYFATRGIAAGKETVAFSNAYEVMDLERRLGLFHELAFQGWLLAEPAALRFLNFIYAYTHMAALIMFGAWVFLAHHEHYAGIRNAFVVLLGLGLTVYVLYPLAPPRFFPYTGFVDTLAMYSGANYDQPSLAMVYNPFAAMPSLHIGFSLFTGIGLIKVGRRLVHWLLGITFPLLMLAAVVGTGNHYILDAIVGALFAGLAYVIAPRIAGALASLRRGRDVSLRPVTR